MKSLTIPSCLYLPIKLRLLIGFVLPFAIWSLEAQGVVSQPEAAPTTQAAKPIEQSGTTQKPSSQAAPSGSDSVSGINVSHYQGNVDWRKVAKTNVKFAYAKATSGEGFVDPQFAQNWQLAREAGLLRGAYHFFLAGDDPIKQARHYVRTVGKLGSKDMPPMLNVETDDNTDIKTLQDRALAWLKEVEKSTGRRPIVYTDNGFADKVLADSRFARYPLWIAEYANAVTKVPAPWTSQGWNIWQHATTGKLSGIDGDVGMNKFNGSLADLRTFIKKSHVK